MADLTTIDAVKTYLGMSASENAADPRLARLISSESARFVSLSGNPILAATITETRNGSGTRAMVPHRTWLRYPITAVSSVVVDGATIPARVGTADGWVLVEGQVALVGYSFTRGVGNVVLMYTAGFAEVPADVDQAVVEMVALKLRGAERIGLMSQSVGGETVSYQTLTLPESVQSVIDVYSPLGIA